MTALCPIATLSPRTTSDSTTALGATPAGGVRGGGAKRSTNFENSSVGFSTKIRMGGISRSKSRGTNAAVAALFSSSERYFALPKKVISPSRASTVEATPRIAASPSALSSIRPPTRAASSLTEYVNWYGFLWRYFLLSALMIESEKSMLALEKRTIGTPLRLCPLLSKTTSYFSVFTRSSTSLVISFTISFRMRTA